MRRLTLCLALGTLIAAMAALGQPGVRPAYAAFHCMRIHAVAAGFNANGNVQYVELRMNAGGQAFVAGHTIQFYDGANVLKATFTFPSSVSNATVGDSVLIGTSEFNTVTAGGDADFTFAMSNTTGSNGGDPLHPVQTPGGRVHFAPGSDNCDPDFIAGSGEADSVAYGTAAAHFGTAASPLPTPSNSQTLRLGNLSTTPTNNSTEYSLQAVSASTFVVAPGDLATDFSTPRNNGRTVLQLTTPSVGGVGMHPLGGQGRLDTLGSEEKAAPNSRRTLIGFAFLVVSVVLVLGVGGAVAKARTRRSDAA